jgi:hypothetical protein
MILAKSPFVAPFVAPIRLRKQMIIRRNVIVNLNSPITDIVIGAIAFGVIYDVSSTLLRKRIPIEFVEPDVIEPIVVDDIKNNPETEIQNIIIEITDDLEKLESMIYIEVDAKDIREE